MNKAILVVILLFGLISCGGGSSSSSTPEVTTPPPQDTGDTENDNGNDNDDSGNGEQPTLPTALTFDFEDQSIDGWLVNGGGDIAVAASGANDSGFSLQVTNRNNVWDGPALALSGVIQTDAPYFVELDVKQSNALDSNLKLTVRYISGGNQVYQPLTELAVTNSEWHTLTGYLYLDANWSDAVIYIEGLEAGNNVSIDNVSIVQDPNYSLAEFTSVDVPSLKALSQMPIGIAVAAAGSNKSALTTTNRQNIVEAHFSQLTAENIMKASYLWQGENDYHFGDADKLLSFAQQNNMTLHCHVAVWHFQTPNWIANYQGSQTQWAQLLNSYVTDVTSHFGDGCYSWDVVNEAFYENGTLRKDDANGELGSIWMQNIGEQYLENSFITARAASPNSLLYYNDFNLAINNTKFQGVKAMAEDFIARDIPIDGIGFQMHITDTQPSRQQIAEKFAQIVDLGLLVKITELDIRMNESGRFSELSPYLAERQKQRYKEVVEVYLETVPQAQRGGISVWGVLDSDSWILDLWPQADWPLLFDSSGNAKPALQGFTNALTSTSNE